MVTGLEKKKGNAKECLNYQTITLISHASKVMLKILQAKKEKKNSPSQVSAIHEL